MEGMLLFHSCLLSNRVAFLRCVEDLPVFETPVGKLAVLICADSWFPEQYKALKEKGNHFHFGVIGLLFLMCC